VLLSLRTELGLDRQPRYHDWRRERPLSLHGTLLQLHLKPPKKPSPSIRPTECIETGLTLLFTTISKLLTMFAQKCGSFLGPCPKAEATTPGTSPFPLDTWITVSLRPWPLQSSQPFQRYHERQEGQDRYIWRYKACPHQQILQSVKQARARKCQNPPYQSAGRICLWIRFQEKLHYQ